MAQKTKGLGGNPLAKKKTLNGQQREQGADRRRTLVGALQTESSAAAAAVRTVAIAELARNPENPDDRWADEGLVLSVREVGVLVPLTVMSAEVFLDAYPEHRGTVDGRPWVILAGHRRHDAASKASVEEVPVLVRDDLGDRAGEVMIGENVHRTALTPMQEARAYQRNLERTGLSQRKLGEHLGVPQSQISKRLRLLTLPSMLHQYIDAGEVDLEVAQQLVESLKDEPVRERFEKKIEDPRYRGGNFTLALNESEREARDERRREVGEQAAEAEGLPFVASPGQKFGTSYYNHQLHTKTDINKARKAGTLVVGPAGYNDEPTYFTTAKAAGRTYDEQQKAENKARTQARKARRQHLASTSLKVLLADAEEWQRRAILHGLSLSSNWTTNARKLCQEHGVGPATTEDWSWRNEVAEVSRNAGDLAGLITVSLWEEQLSLTHIARWNPAACAFFDWLITTGYEPTAWEQERRKNSEQSDRTEQGDSAESPVPEDTADPGDSTESPATEHGEDV